MFRHGRHSQNCFGKKTGAMKDAQTAANSSRLCASVLYSSRPRDLLSTQAKQQSITIYHF